MHAATPPGSVTRTPRRASTSPAPAPTSQSPAAAQSGDAVVETLYNHPSVKITAFTAGPRVSMIIGRSEPPEIEPGTLPWSSPIERTIAVGPFCIYRAPGSVAFLSCGSALQPILSKSQCWCIDEVSSKFVLQIRRPQYWRIELPVSEGADAERAQQLRDVFDKVLQFEKTPCPFQRAFTVELPEQVETPKKRPWTPVHKTSVQLPLTPVTPEDLTPRAALMGRRSSGITTLGFLPEDDEDPPTLPVIERIRREEEAVKEREAQRLKYGDGKKVKSKWDKDEEDGPDADAFSSIGIGSIPLGPISRLPPGFAASRDATSPPQLNLATPSGKTTRGRPVASQSAETSVSNSPTDSSASFHSMQSWHSPITPLPPSPPLSNPSSPRTYPYPHDNIAFPTLAAVSASSQSAASATIVQSPTFMSPIDAKDELSPGAGASMEAFEEAVAPAPVLPSTANPPATTTTTSPPAGPANEPGPRPPLRSRATTTSISVNDHCPLNPLPPPANLITPQRKLSMYSISGPAAATRLEMVRSIPSAIIHKTCEILLAPPSHLINLMLQMAARIAAGEWRGFVFGLSESGERIPVHWDLSDSDTSPGSRVGGDRYWEVRDGRFEYYHEEEVPVKTTAAVAGGGAPSSVRRRRCRGSISSGRNSPPEGVVVAKSPALPSPDGNQSWEVD